LALLGNRINSLAVRKGRSVADESDGWFRLANWVMRRPVLVALATTGVLLALASPLLNTVLTGPSAEAVPPNQPSYAVNTYVTDHYPRSVTEGITVVADGSAGDAQLAALDRRILAIDGIAEGTPFTRVSNGVSYAEFAADDRALRSGPQDAVREIRALAAPGSTQILVTGNTARFIDQKQSLSDHTPMVVGFVALTTLLILFFLTGSVILPIKTLVMNTLTLAATLGIVVLGFQEGLLDSLFNYTGPDAIEVTSLVFVFAVTFGLATDYAVLVLARIKEDYDSGMSNEQAVAHGIGRTGRVITAAAVMIAVVFLAFGVSSVFFMKQIAVAQAVGVLIDASIVRALLVPALMRLFGYWNWWAPKPLRWLHYRYGIRETG
jgi:RND superfamily putative drug exporter